jgi:DNA adenine methylase
MNSNRSKSPQHILEICYERARSASGSVIADENSAGLIEQIGRNLRNRAAARLVLACALAKAVDPQIDIRQPYTEIGGNRSFSGRSYDERYITDFILRYQLPCNPTTAFLTPALRNITQPLTLDVMLEGRPREIYRAAQLLFDRVEAGVLEAQALLTEMMRILIAVRDENRSRLNTLLTQLQVDQADLPLAVEDIIQLMEQHLNSKGASRLPVLMIAAVYDTIADYLGERILDLQSHNAADRQTGSLGDLEIALRDDDNIVTVYEMKLRPVTLSDITIALEKLKRTGLRPSNYIFITTHPVAPEISAYCRSMYPITGGVEVVVLECIDLLRHFLHLFSHLRTEFLDAYQRRLLIEPDSAVSPSVKEQFLTLRFAAQSGR